MIELKWSALPLATFGLLLGAGCADNTEVAGSTTADIPVVAPDTSDGFDLFISPGELQQLQQSESNLLIVDVRNADEYAAGHIPGAVNLPGKNLRTPSAKPGEGDSQYIFLNADGEPDIERYEQILGEAGISRDTPVVVYGNHAGKADGTIPVMILDWLGHDNVRYLDGIAMSRWQEANLPVETEANKATPTTFKADPKPQFVWTLDDVLEHVGDGSVVFYDTRSAEEYAGTDLRSNERGGHIPGAIAANYEELLDEDRTIRSREEAEAIFAFHGLPEAKAEGKPIVLYCQTSTRVSLPYLMLRELGYDNVYIYDASWHEYGNREDTPIEN